MQPLQKRFGLGLVLTMLLSAIPATQMRADGWIGMLLKKSKKSPNYELSYPAKDKVLLWTGAITLPILINHMRKNPGQGLFGLCLLAIAPWWLDYGLRKPYEDRFDKEKLKNGTWQEKLLQIEYFMADHVFGIPYKNENKPKDEIEVDFNFDPKTNCGKAKIDWKNKQYPQGAAGNIDSWLINGIVKKIGYSFVMILALETGLKKLQEYYGRFAKSTPPGDATIHEALKDLTEDQVNALANKILEKLVEKIKP